MFVKIGDFLLNLRGFLGNILVTTTTKILSKVLRYKWEAYCNTKWGAYCDRSGKSTDNISLSLEPRGTKSTAIQLGGVLQYKWEVYCDIFFGEVVVVGVSDILLIFLWDS